MSEFVEALKAAGGVLRVGPYLATYEGEYSYNPQEEGTDVHGSGSTDGDGVPGGGEG